MKIRHRACVNERKIKTLDFFFADSISMSKKISFIEHRANPFFNILNTTTKSALIYPDLIGNKSCLWRLLHSIVGALRNLILALRYAPTRIKLSVPDESIDFLFVSHLTNAEHLKEPNDFYFGDMAKFLCQNGLKAHTVLINHCGVNSNQLSSLKRLNTTVLPAYLNPISELYTTLRMTAFSLLLPKHDKASLSPKFTCLARAAQFGSQALGNYRIGSMLARFIEAKEPRFVMHTFEGHGWEKILAVSVHKNSPLTKIIGYQHAVIFPGKKSLNFDHGSLSTPDIICTTGSFTKQLLSGELSFNYDKIVALGSCRSGKLRAPRLNDAFSTCLFAPEGTEEEVRIMLDVGLDTAKKCPDVNFVLRLHPVIKPALRKTLIKKLESAPKNFYLSNESLDYDLQNSSWVCYRGSSVVFQGILNGLRPIYIDTDASAAVNNPIPSSVNFLKTARNTSELISFLKEDISRLEKTAANFQKAQKFSKDYFAPLNYKELLSIVKAK